MEPSFNEWLQTTMGYQKRTARDVECRLRRVAKFFDLEQPLPDDELLFRLSRHPEFTGITVTIRSQIRKSIRLYKQYQKEAELK